MLFRSNAAFAEVNVPVFGGGFRRTLLQQLSVSGSYRFEDYGSGGASRNPRAGVAWRGTWLQMMQVNLHSRLAQRVLVQLSDTPYRQEQDIYEAARQVPWERWFTPRQTFKIDITAQHSPLKSLNFAALRVKDAVADHFRDRRGERPSVEVKHPDVRVYVHLTAERMTLALDTSGEPLFKRGWRTDKGDEIGRAHV